MKKLAIVTTHPIQYYAPVFQLLHERGNIAIKVFYTWGEKALDKYDKGFGKKIAWDIPLLEGYSYEWVMNTAPNPGSHHYKGIINPQLVEQIERFQPDALLVFGWAYHGHLKAIRYFKNKIPVFFRGDSTLLDEKAGIKNILKSIILKWVYKHIDHAFYTGINNKAYFKKFGLKNEQLSFAPHAIDNERFAKERTNEWAELRQSLGIAEDQILLLFAGKLEEKKDPLLLIDAFIQLSKENVHLLVVGNGVLEPRIKEKIQNIPNIHLMDFQNQSFIPVIYQACDLFCLPSQGPGETWGLAVNEAMACNKAVLVSDKVGCAIDLVEEDINGGIFKNNNINDLTNKLDKLTNSKDSLRAYGEHSKVMIENWNFFKIANAIEAQVN